MKSCLLMVNVGKSVKKGILLCIIGQTEGQFDHIYWNIKCPHFLTNSSTSK